MEKAKILQEYKTYRKMGKKYKNLHPENGWVLARELAELKVGTIVFVEAHGKMKYLEVKELKD